MDWVSFRAHRERIKRERGQWAGLFDKDKNYLMDIEDWKPTEWPGPFSDVGSMKMVLPGWLDDGVKSPVVERLLRLDLESLNNAETLDELFHEALHIIVERPYEPRRSYRVMSITTEGGYEYPDTVTLEGVSLLEWSKHLPCWADPSNRSKVVQLQFEDVQTGTAEQVSRKLLGRNAIGYYQQSLLSTGGLVPDSFAWTDDYTDPARWNGFIPDMHPVIVSPIETGIPSDHCVVHARWDNAWDLMKPTWDAAGIMPHVWMWLPGDEQPFPEHATLTGPTAIMEFLPRANVQGARSMLGQAIGKIQRLIDSDDHITSTLAFSDATVPTLDGRNPWVVFDFQDAPSMTITKSSDHTVLVGGKSPKVVNDVLEVGTKTAVSAIVSLIPGLGPSVAELIKGGGEMAAKLSADRFLNFNEFTDKNRKFHHGKFGWPSVAKQGEGNSMDAIQKAWQAKMETEGGLAVEFTIDDSHPYRPGRDFQLGDTVGVHAYGAVWSAYVSEITWISEPGHEVGWIIKLGNAAALRNADEVQAQNAERIRGVLQRLASTASA